jgi:hypothetical protein
MATTVPVDNQPKLLRGIIDVYHDLVDERAGDLLFQHHRARRVTPYRCKVLAQRQDGLLLRAAERGDSITVRVQLTPQLFQDFEFGVPALLEYIDHEAVGGISLVILLKRPLCLVLHLPQLALQRRALIAALRVKPLDRRDAGSGLL